MGADGLAHIGPDGEQDALALVVAGTVGVGLTEVAGGDGAVDRRDDLGQGYLVGGAGQDVTAPDAPLGADETRPLQREQDLLEVRLGQTRALCDVTDRGRRLGAVEGERQQCPAGVVAPCRNPHPVDATGPHAGLGGAGVVGCASVSDGAAAQMTVAEAQEGVEGVGRTPVPLLPDWAGPCLHKVVPSLLGHLANPDEAVLPPWFPEGVAEAAQIVLFVIDGLGAQQLQERRQLAPVLSEAAGGSITTVAPSTTACALTSLVTGKVPAEHGVVGYRLALGGEVMNVLQWSLEGADARMRVPAPVFQPFPSFPGSKGPVPVVTRHDYGPTGFTAAHLGRVELNRWHTPAGLVTAVRELTAAGAPFVYAYYEGIDKVAHARGLGQYYDDELRAVDRLVGDVLDVLPPAACLVVTADHGQVDVGGSVEVLGPDIMKDVTLISGEGRFRWLHVRPGAGADVAADGVGAPWRRGLGEVERTGRDGGLARGRALPRGGGTSGRRGPRPVRPDRVPRSGRHGRAPPASTSRVADPRRDVDSPARLASLVMGGVVGDNMGTVTDGTDATPPESDAATGSGAISPDEVLAGGSPDGDAEQRTTESVNEPAKVLRIGSMVKTLLDEVRAAPLDEKSRVRLREIYEQSIRDLSEGLSPDLVAELERMAPPFDADAPSDAELRIAQAQLVGWLEGLFHGIQATLMSQQMAARAQLEEMRQRGLPSAGETGRTGAYL